MEPCDPDYREDWTWDRRERSPEVHILDNELKVVRFHPNWSSGTAAIRGTRILNNGRHYWEIMVSRRIFGTSMMFGIGTKNVRLQSETFTNIIGEDKNGWALSHKGLAWHGGRWHHYTKPFVENESVNMGILFDGLLGTLTYFKDGVNLGVAFRGLEKVKEPMYPMISSTAAKTQMALGRTKYQFLSLQHRCRAVILKSVCDREDVEYLKLPVKIKMFICESGASNRKNNILENEIW